MRETLGPLKWDVVGAVEFTGKPTADDLKRGRELGRTVAEAVASDQARA
jgi:hypothetical protein